MLLGSLSATHQQALVMLEHCPENGMVHGSFQTGHGDWLIRQLSCGDVLCSMALPLRDRKQILDILLTNIFATEFLTLIFQFGLLGNFCNGKIYLFNPPFGSLRLRSTTGTSRSPDYNHRKKSKRWIHFHMTCEIRKFLLYSTKGIFLYFPCFHFKIVFQNAA